MIILLYRSFPIGIPIKKHKRAVEAQNTVTTDLCDDNYLRDRYLSAIV